MASEKIIADWKKNIFKPIYWLEGEEPYFIDQVVHFAENHLLSETETEFNRTVFYGKDALLTDVVNACMRYPVFAERQLVLIKEAQHMRDIIKLEHYLDNPLKSTILVIAYKDKKVDQRTKFSKLLKEKGVILTTKKLYDNQLPEWTSEMITGKGFSIKRDALNLLIDHIGNDLVRIQQEVEKMAINLGDRKNITVNDIETFIGISKEYNPFEFQAALAEKNLAKAIRIIQFFKENPKAVSTVFLLATLYGFFSKVYTLFEMDQINMQSIMYMFNRNKTSTSQALQAYENYGFAGIEKILLLLHQYNLRSIGVNDASYEVHSLLKEMTVKIIRC